MGASPDALVTGPKERQPYGLVEIKCPAHAEKMTLLYKSKKSFTNGKYQLKKTNNYYYQIQSQM